MRLPNYKDMIDEDTIAFFPFNGNLNNEVSGGGGYSFHTDETPVYTDITIGNKTVKCIYHTNGSSGILWFMDDTYTIINNDFTIDFMFRIFQNNTGYICRLFEYRSYSSSLGVILGLKQDNSINDFIITRGDEYIYYRIPLDEKFKSTYHHMAVTKKDTNFFTFFLDGNKIFQGNLALGDFATFRIDIRRSNPANLFYYRFRKGIKYTEDFTSPLEDPYYFLKESNDNMYGVTKKKG